MMTAADVRALRRADRSACVKLATKLAGINTALEGFTVPPGADLATLANLEQWLGQIELAVERALCRVRIARPRR